LEEKAMKKKLLALILCSVMALQPAAVSAEELTDGTVQEVLVSDDILDDNAEANVSQTETAEPEESIDQEEETGTDEIGDVLDVEEADAAMSGEETVSITLSKTKFTYNGKEQKPNSVTVKDASGNIIPSSEYTLTYQTPDSKTPGTYKLTVEMTGDAAGSYEKTYEIVKADQVISMSSATKRLDSKTYTIKAKIEKGNKTGKFSYTSSNPKVATVTSWGKITFNSVGTTTITATTKGSANYNSASKSVDITIIPAPTAITKIVSDSYGQMNVQWRSNTEVDGYQIRYDTTSGMKYAKYAAVTKNTSRSYTRKDMKPGQTYYVQVRTFSLVNGTRYYSSWSGTKSIKISTVKPTPTPSPTTAALTKLKNYITTQGEVNSDGNRVINTFYSDDTADSAFAIVYRQSANCFDFVEMDVYEDAISTMTFTLSGTPSTVYPQYTILFSSSDGCLMEGTLNVAQYNGKTNLSFTTKESAGYIGSYDERNELANETLQYSFEGWEILLENAGLTFRDIGFVSYK
jgi:hypothetical protein